MSLSLSRTEVKTEVETEVETEVKADSTMDSTNKREPEVTEDGLERFVLPGNMYTKHTESNSNDFYEALSSAGGKFHVILSVAIIVCAIIVAGLINGVKSTSAMFTFELASCKPYEGRYANGQSWPAGSYTYYGPDYYEFADNIGLQSFWYVGSYGWEVSADRGVCALDAILVTKKTNGKVDWVKSYADYKNTRRRLLEAGEEVDMDAMDVDNWYDATNEADADGVHTTRYSKASSTVSELTHTLVRGLSVSYDALLNGNLDEAQAHQQRTPEEAAAITAAGFETSTITHSRSVHARFLKSKSYKSSSSSSKKKNKVSYTFNYRYCMRTENPWTKKTFEAIDTVNKAEYGLEGASSAFGQGWSDWEFLMGITKYFSTIVWIILIPYVYLQFLTFKYAYYPSIKILNLAIFPIAVTFVFDIVFLALATKVNSLADDNALVTMKSESWKPMFPTCDVTVGFGGAKAVVISAMAFSIILVVLRVLVLLNWIHATWLAEKTALELSREQQDNCQQSVLYKPPSYFFAEAERLATENSSKKQA